MLGNTLGAGHRDRVKKLKESGREAKFSRVWAKILKHVDRVGPTLVTAGQSSGYVELESVR
jgi:hypothetical protein